MVASSTGKGVAQRPIKVLYIAGWMRSGSTLLDMLLGELEGFFSTGELASFWTRGLIKGRQCGCGARIIDCPVWSAVLEVMHEDSTSALEEARRISRVQKESVRLRNLGRLLAQKPQRTSRWGALRTYVDATDRLYRSLQEVTGARVIVNSSKLPQEAAVLPLVPSIDPYLVHLVRDPRAVAHSMSRQVMLQTSRSDPVRMPRSSTVTSALGWTRINAATEVVKLRYGHHHTSMVRYEDLAKRPRDTLQSIAEFAGEPFAGLRVQGQAAIELHDNHTVWGNAARFKRGLLQVRYDDEWTRVSGAGRRLVATALAGPLLPRYGYPFVRHL